MQVTWVRSLGWEVTLKKEMATHSNSLAWEIPWTEEPSELQSDGVKKKKRVRFDLATKTTTKHFTFCCNQTSRFKNQSIMSPEQE